MKLRNYRLTLMLIIAILTPLGFATKFYHFAGKAWVNNYAGDILYPMFWFFCLLLIFPRFSPSAAAILVFLFSSLVEFTQLFSTSLTQFMRSSFLGRVLVGSSFSLIDIFYYAVGAFAAWLINHLLHSFMFPSATTKPQRHGNTF
ncbi:MAG: DUF2809 domain-containing protein [Calditrichaeota bacterium]|nr:MAG: DUF2809 domain-containing protein [Calditrichota bacterium]